MKKGTAPPRRRSWFWALFSCWIALALAVPPASQGGSVPEPGRQSLAEDGSMRIGEGDRCPVCAMAVSKHRKFASAIQLKDGTTFYFCGTGCMIRTWLHPEAFLDRPAADLRRAVVRDYFTGEPLDAQDALWVAGSDVVGPMGPALVPLKDEPSLEAFRKRHGGKTTFRLEELDDARWEAITGKKALPR